MEQVTIKDIMVPLSEYATVSESASLYEAVLALEKAQEGYARSRYMHRAILVYDKERRIVGKVSQFDVLCALEPRYKGMGDLKYISHVGYSVEFIQSIMDSQGLWQDPLEDICRKASQIKVGDIMCCPTEGEFVKEDATLSQAIHQLIMGRHQSLLVTHNGEVVGILRLSDAFASVCEMIKTCPLP